MISLEIRGQLPNRWCGQTARIRGPFRLEYLLKFSFRFGLTHIIVVMVVAIVMVIAIIASGLNIL